jgi:ribosomal-protein-alanine N-acetyltransferase
VLVLETLRLIIRQYTMEDAADFFALNSNADVMRYIRPVKTRKECDAFLRDNINFYELYPKLGRWAAFEKKTSKFVGSFAIIPIEEESENIQIGYALMPSEWGKGFATELVHYGKKYFFDSYSAETLYAITEQLNIASQKVLLKCGFEQSGVLISGTKELLRFSISKAKFKESDL